MDQLAIDAKAATDLGMHYGDYIAKYKPPELPAERYPKKEEKKKPRSCAVCGKPLPPGACGNTKTCGPICAKELERKRRRKSNKRYWQKKKLEKQLLI